uniref:Uncharacterized protein n=1 Tax=Pseudo-nitzschia australis TaxID=44445 RepID=A0A7S4EN96_9STRA|mmetsp:Transcript_1609/g.3476  ORF Transcript_1609/g.3476 Transcript_1609/m.3476 type:complete len:117 (+) Transcript_1609:142-492(+)
MGNRFNLNTNTYFLLFLLNQTTATATTDARWIKNNYKTRNSNNDRRSSSSIVCSGMLNKLETQSIKQLTVTAYSMTSKMASIDCYSVLNRIARPTRLPSQQQQRYSKDKIGYTFNN